MSQTTTKTAPRIDEYRHITEPTKFYSYYAVPSVRAFKDYHTGKTEIQALFGISGNGHMPIEWPVNIRVEGYMTRSECKKQMARLKKELIKECAAMNYGKEYWTEEMEFRAYWD